MSAVNKPKGDQLTRMSTKNQIEKLEQQLITVGHLIQGNVVSRQEKVKQDNLKLGAGCSRVEDRIQKILQNIERIDNEIRRKINN
jgi:hypothetical protein